MPRTLSARRVSDMSVMQQDVEPHETRPCHCESWDHAPHHWCTNDAIGGAVSDCVGNVCRECADGHSSEYIIWPVTLPENQSVYTLRSERALSVARKMFGEDLTVIVVPAPAIYESWDDEYRVALTWDQWCLFDAARHGMWSA